MMFTISITARITIAMIVVAVVMVVVVGMVVVKVCVWIRNVVCAPSVPMWVCAQR